MNNIVLVGNVGGPPTLRHTTAGVPLASLSLATDRFFRDREGQRQKTTEWHRLVVWGEGASTLAKIVARGDQLSVRGRLEYRLREIAGERVKDAVIHVHEWHKLSPRRPDEEAPAAPAEGQEDGHDGDGFGSEDEAALAAGDVEIDLAEELASRTPAPKEGAQAEPSRRGTAR
jgi:single-strand DNA-binding protein